MPATLTEPYKSSRRSRFAPSEAARQLFGPHLYQLYINWQRDIGHPTQAAQYRSTAEWQRVQDAARSEEEKKKEKKKKEKKKKEKKKKEKKKKEKKKIFWKMLCRHSLHPGNPCTAVDVCPECVIRECIASLDRISSVWRQLGGPCKPARSDGEMSPEEHSRISLYYALRRLWHAEKTRWANLVHRFAGYAEWEATWEAQSEQVGFAVPEAVNGASSCSEALEMAWQSPLLVEGWDEVFVPSKRVEESDTGMVIEGHWLGNECPIELPRSPPASLGETKNALPAEALAQSDGPWKEDRNQPDSQGLFTRPEESGIPSTVSGTTAFRQPSPSVPPKNTTSSTLPIHAPSSPPPAYPPPILMSPPVPRGVTFPDDLGEASSRPAHLYRRGSSSYQQGRHASPSGTEWADTSFMYDPWYEAFGADEDEDEKMNQLEGARDGTSSAGSLGVLIDMDVDFEDDEDESEDGEEEEDTFENGRSSDMATEISGFTCKAKRKRHREAERGWKRRPTFKLRWREIPSPESTGKGEKETDTDLLVGSHEETSVRHSSEEDVSEEIVS
ncbi:hypothetical protein DDE83_001249 [Stemphylium lycopersici]|uniref:Uncharacterized protein n=1 Tax=Stemphylium lycopersici TaxID=183478 RepID=A0A364NDR8_STELY|nr:hypothetical protein DDE83_001249 [Stemphylium lycopersici]